jgi:hypothetical protein
MLIGAWLYRRVGFRLQKKVAHPDACIVADTYHYFLEHAEGPLNSVSGFP